MGRLRAVHLGHAQVHEHDVGPGVACEVDGLGAVGGGPDDLEVVDQADEHRQSVADDALVVGDDDTDHAGMSSSTRQPVWVGPACISTKPSSSRRETGWRTTVARPRVRS